MARIAGVNISPNKHIIISLRGVYGIGPTRAKKICTLAKIDPATKTKDLSEVQLESIRQAIGELEIKVEGDLRREVAMNIKRLIDIGSYRGTRHKKGLPVRGQRTRTNARTRKGKGRGKKTA